MAGAPFGRLDTNTTKVVPPAFDLVNSLNPKLTIRIARAVHQSLL